MTNRITISAADARIGDHIYNGTGASAHPTFAWETITRVDMTDGLVVLITGSLELPHGEFWFEPDESIVVMRYPPGEPVKPVPPPQHKAGHGHSG
jgi:hypothetical protein